MKQDKLWNMYMIETLKEKLENYGMKINIGTKDDVSIKK